MLTKLPKTIWIVRSDKDTAIFNTRDEGRAYARFRYGKFVEPIRYCAEQKDTTKAAQDLYSALVLALEDIQDPNIRARAASAANLHSWVHWEKQGMK